MAEIGYLSLREGSDTQLRTIVNIAHIEEPKLRWCLSSVHSSTDNAFKCLVTTFKHVLVFVVRFTTPEANQEQSEEFQDLVASLVLGMVTKEL